jgi:hypothetical protein
VLPQTFPFPRDRARELLEGTDTFATVIHAILIAAYGEAIYSMDPLELYAQVKEDFDAVIHEEGENRINAIMTALTSDLVYQDPEAFSAVAEALNSGDIGDAIGGMFDDLTMPEVVWALYELQLNREDEEPFSPAVKQLIDRTIAEENSERGSAHVDEFMDDQKTELHAQFAKLGVPAEPLLAHLA